MATRSNDSSTSWRTSLSSLRWLLLGSACAAVPSCGGDSDAAHVAPALECDSTVLGGWERCNGGVLHRVEIAECPSALPRDRVLPSNDSPGTCEQDSDCVARPHGYCEQVAYEGNRRTCLYGCTRDDECEANQACVCGAVIGECQPATCRSDADCEEGLACTAWRSPDCFGGYPLSCQSFEDRCVTDADCGSGLTCWATAGQPYRSCRPIQGCPVPGRPFLIEGEVRRAHVVTRADWQHATHDPAALSAELGAALGAHWLEQGLMEHASVAAFARFTLQLLSVAAPAELVAASARAMQDEIAHTEACFGLARRYAGKDLGPGPLPLDGALEARDLGSIVQDTVLEGCIGETVAAVEAAEAAARCEDEAVRPLLERIAREESQHAALAWRFVRWALEREPALRARVRALFARVLNERCSVEPLALEPNADELARHGVLAPRLRQRLEQRVLIDVIAPCARELCGTPRPEIAAHSAWI